MYDKNRKLTGRTHRRGDPLMKGDYHLVVHIWIQNTNGDYLITKRTPNKGYPNMWECTGGSAVAGDDSMTAAIREVNEETGLFILPEHGQRLFVLQHENDFCDVWLFRQDFDMTEVILQENETCAAKWATKDEIRNMIVLGAFIPFHYIEELFGYGGS